MKVKTAKIRVVFKEVSASHFFEGHVIRNNDTSGKITAPKKWIGKNVIVLLAPSGRKDRPDKS